VKKPMHTTKTSKRRRRRRRRRRFAFSVLCEVSEWMSERERE